MVDGASHEIAAKQDIVSLETALKDSGSDNVSDVHKERTESKEPRIQAGPRTVQIHYTLR